MLIEEKYTHEYFKDLLRSVPTLEFNDIELERNVQEVSISSKLAEELIEGIETLRGVQYIQLKMNIHFHMLSLTPRDELWSKVEEEFSEYEFAAIRVHKYEPKDLCEQHRDNIHKGYSSMSIRLNEGNPRFYVGSKLMPETAGIGYILPEHTLHSVNSGVDVRYSLVAWLKKKV